MKLKTRVLEALDAVPATEVNEQVAALRSEVHALAANETYLQESLAQLEQGLYEPGWVRAAAQLQVEFSAEGLVQLRAICKLYAIKNPLITRGLNLRSAYVWGRGVEITARANGKNLENPGEQDVQAVISAFLNNPKNVAQLTGPEARDQLEHALGTDGEIYVACFTRPTTGQVQVRVLCADEIVEMITDPHDRTCVWFYRRRYIQTVYDLDTGVFNESTVEAYHPDINYKPTPGIRARTRIGAWPVMWDAPILHMAVNEPLGWQRGIPDVYAALDWTKAYTEFLTDWARLMRSLSRYAWKATAPGAKAAQLRSTFAAAPTRDALNGSHNSAGATAIMAPDVALEAISKSGATIDADSGRPLVTMVAAALGLPVTVLLGDPGLTGARATAETLDNPTNLVMGQRQAAWSGFYKTLLNYVIAEAVRARTLLGAIIYDPFYQAETVTLAGDTSTEIDIAWPDMTDIDPAVLVEAIVKAQSMGIIEPEIILRLALTALGVRNVDDLVDAAVDDQGNFAYPSPPDLGMGDRAVAALAAGRDPAAVGGSGQMAGQPEPVGAGARGG